MNHPRIPSFKSPEAFRAHLRKLRLELPLTQELPIGSASPLNRPLHLGGRTIGNRWAIQPMEGWDGTPEGGVTAPMRRRWQRFGESGAKLIWGGEAMAVRPDGRANPNQLVLSEQNGDGIASLVDTLKSNHAKEHGRIDDLMIGFQLTHSGRFCRPSDPRKLEPRIAFRHPLLDTRFGIADDRPLLTDDEVRELIEAYIAAAALARRAGADFVDIKHCHGYLLHEFLGAHTRPGEFGGSFENRTRILRAIVAGIRAEVPGLEIGVRLSAFDFVPYRPDPTRAEPGKLGPGIPEPFEAHLPYRFGFGMNPDRPTEIDLTEPKQFLALLHELGIRLVNLTAGSPYYNPHIQRPALYPPSDGYQPPEDPLVGVVRQMRVVRELRSAAPQLLFIGSAYSYLQEYLPHVATAAVREGWVDLVGLGRMVLSHPRILDEAVRVGNVNPKFICRTFSDCTTAPRNGLPSGCYPLDPYYKASEQAAALKQAKRALPAQLSAPAP